MKVSDIQVLTHSSIRIRTASGIVYADPFHVEGEPRDASLILVTHSHYDHFSPEDIRKICGDGPVTLVIPESMEKEAAQALKKQAIDVRIVTVRPGTVTEVCGLKVEAVPSYNIGKFFHPKKEQWVGYILTDPADSEGTRVYIAGDTDVTPESLRVRCDIALIPVGGTYTMNAVQAAKLINTIRPAVVIPTHYGSIVGKPGDGERFASLVEPPVEVVLQL